MDNSFLHPEILSRTTTKVIAGDYDGAILDATEYLEVKLQSIGGTKAINTTLVKEVFENNKLSISAGKDRNIGALYLFDGMFRLIRNDRGHDKSVDVKVEISCDNESDCLKYLGFLSLLHHYLDRNLINSPVIQTISYPENGMSIRGKNFTTDTKVFVNDVEANVLSYNNEQIEILMPKDGAGTIQLENGLLRSNVMGYQTINTKIHNLYKVVAVNVVLYEDKDCLKKRDGIFGVKMQLYEEGRSFFRIFPTRNTYKIGDYLAHEFNSSESIGESRYRDPLNQGGITYGRTGSSLFAGTLLGEAGVMNEIRISIGPEKVVTGVGEIRFLRSIITTSDSIHIEEHDFTDKTERFSEDASIAYIDNKTGILRAKGLGKTYITCKYNDFHDRIEVEVITPMQGLPVKYFKSNILRYESIAFNSKDDIFIANQNSYIYKLDSSNGCLEKIIQLPAYNHPQYGLQDYPATIDNMFINHADTIFLNSSQPRAAYYYNDGLLKLIIEYDTIKGIQVDTKGVIYLATMKEEILKISPDGTINHLSIPIMSVDIALINDDIIAVSSAGGGDFIGFFSTLDGSLVNMIESEKIKTPSCLLVRNGLLYVAGFYSGKIHRIECDKNYTITEVAFFSSDNFIIGTMAFDTHGDLYVGMFSAKEKRDIAIYKIYL